MNLLTEVTPTLPSAWYYDAEHYALELEAIWYRDWVCVARLESLEQPGDYRVTEIGDQSIIVALDQSGHLRAFHNTCRHRGSRLTALDCGRFRQGRIVCPYHSWSYALDGALMATPGRIASADFDAASYRLYEVSVDCWGGFVFVNLAATPEKGLREFLGAEADGLAHWPLAELRSVHQEVIGLSCNWKIFWENYSECYHCPRVHPELCRIMPVYRKAVSEYADLPDWQPRFEGDDGRGTVAEDATTWTLDGQSDLPAFEGLTDAEHRAGVAFASLTGSMYIVAHPDYVRSVRILPKGPEAIELAVDWLLPAEASVTTDQLRRLLELPLLVLEQDGRVCEVNQHGLRSRAHAQGVLMPQEHALARFHEWIRARVSRIDSVAR